MIEPSSSTTEEQLEHWRGELARVLKANPALPWQNLIDWAEEAEEFSLKTCTRSGRAKVVKQEERLASMERAAAAWQKEAQYLRGKVSVPVDTADAAEFLLWSALDRPLTEEEYGEHIRTLRGLRLLATEGLIIVGTTYTEAKRRLLALHTPVEHMGKTWCAECSVRRRTGPKTEEWVAFVPHPCHTIEALDGTGWPPEDTTPESAPTAGLPDGPFEESREYGVVGGWGVDGARDAADARRQVREALAQYPTCDARARWRIVRTWEDDAQYVGPWQPLPDEEAPAVGQVLTSRDPEPPDGTTVRDDCGTTWIRTSDPGSGYAYWFQVDHPDWDTESWVKVAGNYGPVTVLGAPSPAQCLTGAEGSS